MCHVAENGFFSNGFLCYLCRLNLWD